MVHIDKNYLRTILAQAFKLPEDQIVNPSLCIPIGKSVKMYSDAIERGASRGMHLLFCRNYEKVNNQWLYELEYASAIWIEPQFFRDIITEYSVNNQQLPTGMITIDLQSILEIPDSKTVLSTDLESEVVDVDPDPIVVQEEPKKEEIIEEINFDIEYDTDMDRPADKFTRREYTAILLKVPSSGTKWVDDMINLSIKLNNK